jgi:hypothetical protein
VLALYLASKAVLVSSTLRGIATVALEAPDTRSVEGANAMRTFSDALVGRWLPTLVLFAVLCAPLCATAQTNSRSSEFEIADEASLLGLPSDLAMFPDEGFVAVWGHAQLDDGDGGGVFAQVFAAPQTPATGVFQVNEYTTDQQRGPRVASSADGHFVVTWESLNQDGTNSSIYARLFDSAGVAMGTEFRVNAYTSASEVGPRPAYLDGGDFVVIWAACGLGAGNPCQSSFDDGPDGDDTGVFARRFDAAGNALGGDFQINTYTTRGQGAARVAPLTDGGFVVVWGSQLQDDGESSGVYARRFDSSAAPLTGEFLVNSITKGDQVLPVVARAPDGGFVVTWFGPGRGNNLFIQRYDATGATVGDGERVPPLDHIVTYSGDVGVMADGRALVVFGGFTLESSGSDLFGRFYNTDGSPDGDMFSLGGYLPGYQDYPRMAMHPSGSFVMAYDDLGSRFDYPLGLREGNYAYRYCAEGDALCEICPGFDDSIDTDSDGRPDGCDPCVNDGTHDMTVKTRLHIRNQRPVFLDKIHRLGFKGQVVVTGGLAALDPLTQGMRLRIESVEGGAIVDVSLTPGAYAGKGTAGWRSNRRATKWIFRDKTDAPADGIVKALVQDRSALEPGRVRVKVKGSGGAYPIAERYPPVHATVIFGDESASVTGRCGETTFSADDCGYGVLQLRCRN